MTLSISPSTSPPSLTAVLRTAPPSSSNAAAPAEGLADCLPRPRHRHSLRSPSRDFGQPYLYRASPRHLLRGFGPRRHHWLRALPSGPSECGSSELCGLHSLPKTSALQRQGIIRDSQTSKGLELVLSTSAHPSRPQNWRTWGYCWGNNPA